MAKIKEKTTGQPLPAKRDPAARRYKSRAERENQVNRLVVIVAGVIFGAIILILLSTFIVEGVITPNQAVASVGGQNVSTRDFQRRVVFERWRSGLLLNNVINQFGAQYAQQILGSTNNPYGQLYAQLSDPTAMGRRVLDDMLNNLIIKQYADANGIKVDEADIDKRMRDYFGFDPDPKTATATITPSITPTLLVSPTPTTTPTVTPQPSQTATITPTPIPTGVPTATPGATERAAKFSSDSKDYYDRAQRATGYSEADLRAMFAEDALRDKVKEAIVGKQEDVQEQVQVRQILVGVEDQANEVMAAIQKGESFSDLAKAVSTDTGSKDTGGFYDWAPKGQYVTEFEDAIWSDKAKIGDVLGPVKTQYGFHIIQLLGREKRAVTEDQKTQAAEKKFSDWLTAQTTEKGATKYDYWSARVPTNPSLAELGLQ